MTAFLIDLASYQQGIDLTLPAYDPYGAVNIKTSQGNWYVAFRDRSRAWADQARSTGRGIMTFHWLDESASGAEQARIACQEMRELGGPDGMAHQADTEDDGKAYGPLTYKTWAAYVDEMQQLLGRHVINYTGDWWWEARGWDGAALTPFLMAAPNAGYLSSYPGDQSGHWYAGYGGWYDLAAMQYAVGPIPGGGPGAGNVSQTAIRDPQVWAALTGGKTMPAMDYGDFPLPTDDYATQRDRRNHLAILLADLAGAEMVEHSLWDNSRGKRTERLIRIEQKLTDQAINLKALSDKVDALALGGVDLDILAVKIAALFPALPTAAQMAEELGRRLGNG